MSLSLNCLILGDQPNRIFTVKVPKSDNVSILKDLIKEKKAPHLNHIAASDLDLWQVSFPVDDSLETKLGDIDLSVHRKLSPSIDTLDTFFTDVANRRLHVIAKVPEVQTTSALDPNQLLLLNCFILDDRYDKTFTVKVPKTDNVSILKKLIKEQNPSSLGNVDVKDIDLWKVSFPIDKLPFEIPPTPGPKMKPEMSLSGAFPLMLRPDLLHVVVRAPGPGAPPPSSRPPPSAYRFPVISANQMAQERATFCHRRKSEAPSNGGQPPTFLGNQKNPATHIPCNRPYGSSAALPLSLLHPIFGEFVDDAENRVPTPDDAQFFLDFVAAMVNIYETEQLRQDAVLKVFEDHGMPIKPTKFSGFTTEGDLSYKHFRYLIAEIKNEIGSKAAEPYFQGVLYALEALRNHAPQHSNSVLPCIIVLIFGPYIAFAGVAWTDRPTIQMLSPAIPCHYQDGNLKIESMLVRHLGALQRATQALNTYYNNYDRDQSTRVRHPTEPYRNSFTSKDGSEVCFSFTYRNSLGGRILFFGRMNNSGMPICVKFVPCYCKEGHEFLAAKSFAPKLHAVERLPGGLFMVVMDDVSDQYVSLFDFIQDRRDWLQEHTNARDTLSEKLKACLHQFHMAGFVHGDIRNTNIMVKKGGFDDGSFLVVDYDSSGKKVGARYPLNLNTMQVQRPEGATGGAVIEIEHDLEMLEYIWDV